MKVVLICGRLGLRLRDYADRIPKPFGNIRLFQTQGVHSLPRLSRRCC